jgi:hypothetical protein
MGGMRFHDALHDSMVLARRGLTVARAGVGEGTPFAEGRKI